MMPMDIEGTSTTEDTKRDEREDQRTASLLWCRRQSIQSIEMGKTFQTFCEGDVPGERIRSIELLPLITNQEKQRIRRLAADLNI